MDSGVKVVGGPSGDPVTPDDAPSAAKAAAGSRRGRRPFPPADGARRRFIAVAAVAVLGLVGTLVFGLLWAGSGSGNQDPAVKGAARLFLTTFFNFTPKTVDSDFSSLSAMATGSFASQSNQFFNSSIRSDLEKAAAESRGQIRDIWVQSDNGNSASVYAVVDQEYANNKITTPGSDVVRIVVNLAHVGSAWKISDVTVLEGATPASTGSASGSAGSTVPGQ
jgi:hypothetical protein